MTALASFLLASALAVGACSHCTELDANKLADSIYVIEGGAKASVPYGILSVKVGGEPEARRVCLRTVSNNYARWLEAARPGCFLDFLADRYCPKSVDPVGNRNWKQNVHRREK